MQFTNHFDKYVCVGDRIATATEHFTITARIEHDHNFHIDDDDVHNTDQSVTGCDNAQFKKQLAARDDWFNGEWFYCGLVLSVSRNGVLLDECAASLWGIECNYPDSDNSYLLDIANELLPEAIEAAYATIENLTL